jgi:hypothetical protein
MLLTIIYERTYTAGRSDGNTLRWHTLNPVLPLLGANTLNPILPLQLVGAMAMMLRDTQTIPETVMALVDLISVPEILGATHWDDDPESFTFLIRYEV